MLSFGHSFLSDAAVLLITARMDKTTIDSLAAFESAVQFLDLPIKGLAGASTESVDGAGDSYIIKHVEGSVASPTAKLVYVNKDDSLVLAWRIETDLGSNWLVSYVDAVSGSELAGVTEYTNTASYEAL